MLRSGKLSQTYTELKAVALKTFLKTMKHGKGCRARGSHGAEPPLLIPKNVKFQILLLFFATYCLSDFATCARASFVI